MVYRGKADHFNCAFMVRVETKMFRSVVRNDFPTDFKFGVATAAYQVEGSRLGATSSSQGYSHWDSFSATRGNVFGGDNGAKACAHFENLDTDLSLIQDGGFDSYRFSFSWPRLIPNGVGGLHPDGVAQYDRLLDAMLERGIKPNGTLYHWDLPSALADKGGWQNRDVADWFADYAALVSAKFDDRLDMLATINEPWCVSYLSHFLGAHAPGLRDIRATARSMHHVLYAHGRAMQAMRQENVKTPLGIVLNLQACEPADNSDDARDAAHRLDGIFNRWFLDAVLKGTYPQDMLVDLAPWMPTRFDEDMGTVSIPMDWLGINFYTRELASKSSDPRFPGIDVSRGDLNKTGIGWEIYPDGLTSIFERLRTDYNTPPLYITENGMASHVLTNDHDRVAYFNDHLRVCADALQNGTDLRGYYAWSLLDNFEWAEGYSQRFGLVHIDFVTQTRTPKESYQAFKALLTTHTD